MHFWDLAFEQLKAKGVLYYETEGKNKGCWVMKRGTSRPGNALREPVKEIVPPQMLLTVRMRMLRSSFVRMGP